MSTIEVMRKALEALVWEVGSEPAMYGAKTREAITAIRAELERLSAVEPVAWAISYDGKTPYSLFCEDDCALLDLEVKRLGGTACKLALYSAHIAPAIPALTDEEVSGRFGGYCGVARWAYALAAERAGVRINARAGAEIGETLD